MIIPRDVFISFDNSEQTRALLRFHVYINAVSYLAYILGNKVIDIE